MSGYKKPKKRLHREFVYLNVDTVINSLSAFEAGKVDEIIEKISEAREAGFQGGVGMGPTKVSGGRKKTANVEEELTRTRTNFSAFEEWHRYLDSESAFGELESWDLDTRDELEVGDTIRFIAHVKLTPIQRLLLTFIDFAGQASNPDSALKQPAAKVTETKKIARMMHQWMAGKDGGISVMISLAPLGTPSPAVFARLDEKYLVNGIGVLEGEYTVIAQVESLLDPGATVPAIRILRDTPPTPKETETITEALGTFVEPARALGVEIAPGDLSIAHPAVILHPIAIFR